MVFDPSMIKKRKLSHDNLPSDASREDKILSLAKVLEDRGLASTPAAARRLAEGMVDTEKKVLSDGAPLGSHTNERDAFQRADSPLYQAVGGKGRLGLSEEFRAFVEKAAPLSSTGRNDIQTEQSKPRSDVSVHVPKQVFHDDAPKEPVREWKVPEKDDEGYVKTTVETSDDGVVVRHTEATATSDTTFEQGIILDDATVKEAAEAPEEKKESSNPDVDLFNVFNANK